MALLDLHGQNPNSRLPYTSFRNARGVALWVQRALLVDAWEQQRKMEAIARGVSISAMSRAPLGPGDVIPVTVTTRPSPTFPPTTTLNLSELAAIAPASTYSDATAPAVAVAGGAAVGAAARRKSTASAGASPYAGGDPTARGKSAEPKKKAAVRVPAPAQRRSGL